MKTFLRIRRIQSERTIFQNRILYHQQPTHNSTMTPLPLLSHHQQCAVVCLASPAINETKFQREPLTATPNDVFLKHLHLFVPLLDRKSLNGLCSANREIHAAGRTVALPWPVKSLRVGWYVYSVAFSPDSGLLACGCFNGRIYTRNRTDGNCTSWEGHASGVHSLTFSPDGKLLASVGRGQIKMWKLADSSCRVFRTYNESEVVQSIEFSPDGSALADIDSFGRIRLSNVSDGSCTRTIMGEDRCASLAWSPEGKALASAGQGGNIYFWNLSDNDDKTAAAIIDEGHNSRVKSIAYSPDGRYLASGSDDSVVRLWNVTDKSCRAVFRGHIHAVSSVRFFSNGQNLASCSNYDHCVRLWDAESSDGSCLVKPSGLPLGYHSSVALSPDGRTMASGSRNVVLTDISS